MEIKQIDDINQADKSAWNALVGTGYPFLSHEFLLALEASGCVGELTGWKPKHLLAYEGEKMIGVMPLYLKTHSRGEYVFDHQWVYAYQQNGIRYFPKWLTAIPFTPCQGLRIAVAPSADLTQVTSAILEFIQTQSEQNDISSWHCLFPKAEQLTTLQDHGLLAREGVQFQWLNKGYQSFDDYLATFNHSKRKMLKRERRKVTEQGIIMSQLFGNDASETQWQVFYDFYRTTYFKHGMPPYLNLDFFLRCAETMGDHMLLVFAYQGQEMVGAALNFIGNDTLYGRYWGCHTDYDALHFEACYYQGLDYCIANGLQRFDSGAQGEHKIARGFEPVTTYSAHWFRDERFAKVIAEYFIREKDAVRFYKDDATHYLPFKK